jgi:hypothetical protein
MKKPTLYDTVEVLLRNYLDGTGRHPHVMLENAPEFNGHPRLTILKEWEKQCQDHRNRSFTR